LFQTLGPDTEKERESWVDVLTFETDRWLANDDRRWYLDWRFTRHRTHLPLKDKLNPIFWSIINWSLGYVRFYCALWCLAFLYLRRTICIF